MSYYVSIAGIVLFGIIIGVLGATHIRFDRGLFQDMEPGAILLRADPRCNAAVSACTVSDEVMTIGLRLRGDVAPLRIFEVIVTLGEKAGIKAERVVVRFSMPAMEMGLNRFRLNRGEAGVWRGEAMLPACVTGRQDWLAMIEVEGEAGYAAEFSLWLNPR